MSDFQKNRDIPLVSVIVPAYNAETFIEETLNSILAQTYRNIEVVVVDDGSQDRTAEIVERIAKKDQRVNLWKQPNAGVAAARNLAIQKSRGEYIAPIDADDIWYPQNLEKQVQCILQAGPSVGVVYAWSLEIDEKGLLTGGFYTSNIEGKVYAALVYNQFLCNASASLIRRECFEKVGYYNSKLKEQDAQGCEDWELYLRIAEYYEFRVVREFLIGYRQGTSSMSCNYASMAKSHLLVMADVQQRHPEILDNIYRSSRSNFYIYLARLSSRGGNQKSTLLWLYKAFRLDFLRTILDHKLYVLSIESLLNLIAQPVTFIIWPERRYWLKFKQRFSRNQREVTISDINRFANIQKWLPAKLYERIRLSQWSRSIKIFQPVSLQVTVPQTFEHSLTPSEKR